MASDIIIKKRRWSAFFETQLDAQLRSLGTQYIIVTGCTTTMCIESTIRDAAFRDYICVLPADCTGQSARHDSTHSGHEASLKKAFISWSGQRSQALGNALRSWLPQVIPAIGFFHSEEIPKGRNWHVALDRYDMHIGALLLKAVEYADLRQADQNLLEQARQRVVDEVRKLKELAGD